MTLFRITLRTAGRLLVRGAITHDIAAAMVRSAWAKSSAELMPAGSTSSVEHNATLLAAAGNNHFCDYCPDIPHRVNVPGTRCPACLDDERRGRRSA